MRSLRYFSPGVMVVMLISLVIMLIMQANYMLNCDVSWLMLAVRRLFEGGTYSGNFLETNPPLILFIYMPAALVSYLFPVDIAITARVYFIALALFSFAFSYPFIKTIFKNDDLLSTTFSFLLLLIYLCLPAGDFGQREHLIIVFCIPYLLAVTYQMQGGTLTRKQAVLTGVLAGLSFAIKPFYLITFIAIEIYQILQRKNWRNVLRLDNAVLTAMMVMYALLVLIFFRDYLQVMVPLVSRYYYQGYTMSWQNMINNTLSEYCIIVFGMSMLVRQRNANTHLVNILLISFVTFFFVFLFQFSLMYYRAFPVFAIGILLLGLLLYQLLNDACTGKLNFYLAGGCSLLTLSWLITNLSVIWSTLVLEPSTLYLFFGVLTFCVTYFMHRGERFVCLKTLCSVAIILGSSYVFSNLLKGSIAYNHRFTFTVIFFCVMFGLSVPARLHKAAIIQTYVLWMLLLPFPVFYIQVMAYSQIYGVIPRQEIVNYLKNDKADKSVYVFSTETVYTFPVVDSAKWTNASRIPFFWMLPGLLKEEKNPARLTQAKQDKALLINMIAEDLEKNKPDLIFIDAKHKFIPAGHFSYAEYFFNNAKLRPLWGQYQYITTLKNMPYYNLKVYRRMKVAEIPL